MLDDQATCTFFSRNNSQLAPHPASLWFIKATNGSLGRHVRIWTREEIEEKQASGAFECPLPNTVASLQIPTPWHIDGAAFDNRVYVLLPSLDPLVVLFRPGHLRLTLAQAQTLSAASHPHFNSSSNENSDTADDSDDLGSTVVDGKEKKRGGVGKDGDGDARTAAEDGLEKEKRDAETRRRREAEEEEKQRARIAAHVTNLWVQQVSSAAL